MEKKRRRCGMTRRNGEQYCTEHLNIWKKKQGNAVHNNNNNNNESKVHDNEKNNDQRIPCPLDPNHTVKKSQLEKHLKKCNKTKLKHSNDGKPYYSIDINGDHHPHKEQSKLEITETSRNKWIMETISILEEISKSNLFDEMPLIEKSNKFMEENRFKLLTNKKHAIQQSSLIQHMIDKKMFRNNPNFIEFGSGRAEFSRYVNQVVLCENNNDIDSTDVEPQTSNFIFIDRASNRMKFDKKILDDYVEWISNKNKKSGEKMNVPDIKRVKIDIRDLKLDPLLSFPNNNNYVAISKHLCGVATDLTLKCIQNSDILTGKDLSSPSNFDGICIAMCCRHVCNSNDYVNPVFVNSLLEKYGHDETFTYDQFFYSLQKMCSWATCGRRDDMNDHDVVRITDDKSITLKEREQFGLLARRIIDEGRKNWVKKNLNNANDFTVELVKYVHSDVSLENIVLLVSKK
ncbi:tRNA:m4X modification enzyme NDAI_0G03950 [Naumovozyma dairenensis CBS 421]|uniref:tRNA:m(4)X modification enzyme TRM13 n=1 Tax=Naumovozyma dairenensis (strain ATCC 10597 / BCRC 20456 / CBS 421 / NBRC 0211 / NRRL Y-12639) TaxID=1071378 RepID=G0WEG1_NAUDC|nr:hypothetical protein NDAI_0G03950 [Naumovozyma dairenensis CBS 421]CCD26172.2 hypothetical protein NDAI_0G03950 [Naumovozyma dairenensis CBS 421]